MQETQEEEGPSLEDLEDEILGNEEDLRMEFDDEEDEYNEPDRDYDNGNTRRSFFRILTFRRNGLLIL